MNKETSDKNEQSALISLFCEIASSSTEEAKFFLESHGWDLDASVSTFLDHTAAAAIHPLAHSVDSPSVSRSPPLTPPSSESPSRSRSASPPARSRSPYQLRKRQGKKDMEGGPSRRTHGDVRTLADLNRPLRDDGVDSDDKKTEYYTGGEKSGMIVQDPSKGNDVESIFNQARQSGAAEGPPDAFRSSSSSRSFTGTARMLSGEAISPSTGRQQPEIVTHNINFWSNGFTVDDGPLRRLDDPANLSFLESLKKSECPTELQPADRKTAVHVNLTRKEEDFKKPVKHRAAFEGVGRTLGSCHTSCSDPELTTASTLTAVPAPSVGLIVDENLPTTSIQIRLADGTRMVSRFNHSHTVNDIRSFIHASRPGCGSQNYQLQLMGFPPVQLTDPNQTIEQAGLANSVIIQKF